MYLRSAPPTGLASRRKLPSEPVLLAVDREMNLLFEAVT
jgi:hypothetical protein